jgi:DNA-binding protein H-NS
LSRHGQTNNRAKQRRSVKSAETRLAVLSEPASQTNLAHSMEEQWIAHAKLSAENFRMAKASLAKMSVDALLNLRDQIGKVLAQRADELRNQISRLGGGTVTVRRGRGSTLKGRKVPIKYRDRSGNTWAGRGATPRWLREKLKAGAKLEDFAVDKKPARGTSRKKRRKTKR